MYIKQGDPMIIMKFGGTSVGSPERIIQAADIIKAKSKENPFVVLSAVGGITDKLIESGEKAVEGTIDSKEIIDKHISILKALNLPETLVDKELDELDTLLQGISMLQEISKKTMDRLQSFGERMSVRIMAEYLKKTGTKAVAYAAYDLGLRTDDHFGEAVPLKETFSTVKANLSDLDHIPIITGFIAKTKKDEITTLGRGGSDYTAALIGMIIDAKEIQIWTDVDGVMSCDPRLVDNVKNIEQLSFDEATELSFFGAKVLHPKTIWPAVEKNIPVRVLNTHNPTHIGSVILKETTAKCKINEEKGSCVKVISFKKNVTLVNIHSLRMLDAHGYLAKIFDIFAKHKVSVDMIATSEVDVSMTIDKTDNLDSAIVELSHFSEVKVEKNKAIVCIVGEGIESSPKTPGVLFNTLADLNIQPEMISQGSSEINIGLVIDMKHLEKAVKSLHKKFFE